MSVFDFPGVLTDTAHPRTEDFWVDHGYLWVARQAWNEGPKDGSLSYTTALARGVWGVSYDDTDFLGDAFGIVKQANLAGASFLIWDAEECLKDAHPALLTGALAAFDGFAGEKALSTLGAASGQNIYPIDYKAFLDRGWHILPQAYYSPTPDSGGNSPDYLPQLCIDHMARYAYRAGLDPVAVLLKTHLTVNTAGPLDENTLVSTLAAADFSSPDVSVFMGEAGLDSVYDKLKEVTMRPALGVDATSTKATIHAAALAYEADQAARGNDTHTTRIRVARGVVDSIDIGANGWTAAGPKCRTALGLP